jgi:hypothetical protein
MRPLSLGSEGDGTRKPIGLLNEAVVIALLNLSTPIARPLIDQGNLLTNMDLIHNS